MRSANWTPSIVPSSDDQDVCLVVDDFGRRGRAYCETDVEATDLETVIQDLLEGQYSNPVRVVSFNTAEGWSRDISADVAEELRRRCELEMREIPQNLERIGLRAVRGSAPSL
jgi:hypothetical protein